MLDFVASVFATELLGLVVEVVVSDGCERELLWSDEVVEDVLGEVLATLEVLELELGEVAPAVLLGEDEEDELGVVEAVFCSVSSCVRVGSLEAIVEDDVASEAEVDELRLVLLGEVEAVLLGEEWESELSVEEALGLLEVLGLVDAAVLVEEFGCELVLELLSEPEVEALPESEPVPE